MTPPYFDDLDGYLLHFGEHTCLSLLRQQVNLAYWRKTAACKKRGKEVPANWKPHVPAPLTDEEKAALAAKEQAAKAAKALEGYSPEAIRAALVQMKASGKI